MLSLFLGVGLVTFSFTSLGGDLESVGFSGSTPIGLLFGLGFCVAGITNFIAIRKKDGTDPDQDDSEEWDESEEEE